MKKIIILILTIVGIFLYFNFSISNASIHNPIKLLKSTEPYIIYMNKGSPSGPVESTPIVFNNELFTITSNAISGNYQGTFRVDNFETKTILTVNANDMLYISAFVENDIAYAFGTSRDHTKINRILSHDLKSWTKPVTIFTAPAGKGFYNTSLTKNNDLYVMAVETTDKARTESFVTDFLIGTDLMNLTLTEFFYTNNKFTNCPTLRYFEGYYYLWYMSEYNSQLITFISRSKDLKTWENSGGGTDKLTVPFVPSKNEGNNNSDVDLVEYRGNLFFTYAVGDQTSWLDLHTAVYPDSLKNYLSLFFT